MDINDFTPTTGRTIEEDGTVTNIADMLAAAFGAVAVAGITADINSYSPRTGRIIAEDGQVYNLVDFLRAIIAGGGPGGGGITNHALLSSLGYDQSGHSGFARAVHTHNQAEITSLNTALSELNNRVESIESTVIW